MINIAKSLIFGALCSFTSQATEASCFSYEADIPLSEIDSRLGFSGNDMIRDFNNASQSVSLTWEDGTVTLAHWEFIPALDTARIYIGDYDDDCSAHWEDLTVQGQLALKTDDGRIDAKWNLYLNRFPDLDNYVHTYLNIELQELQGIPGPLEGEVDLTFLSLEVSDGQFYGYISRLYKGEDWIENEDGSITFIERPSRMIAVVGNQFERPRLGQP